MSPAAAFFYRNAGYSYTPGKETKEQGRRRCARALAAAERAALDAGASFEWDTDPDCTSADFSDADPPWRLWICIARDANGDVFASLGAIDFGRDGSPWRDPYRRVVEAELALEMPDPVAA